MLCDCMNQFMIVSRYDCNAYSVEAFLHLLQDVKDIEACNSFVLRLVI